MSAVFPYPSSGVDGPVVACKGVDLNQKSAQQSSTILIYAATQARLYKRQQQQQKEPLTDHTFIKKKKMNEWKIHLKIYCTV